MRICIATWNTQGNPLAPGKKEVLDRLLRENHVVLLQECSQLADQAGYGGRPLVSRVPLGAFNARCSTAIIATRWDEDGRGSEMSCGRAGLWVRVDDVYIGTIHCTASDTAGADKTAMMQAMHEIAGDRPIIIGGDFNCPPMGEHNVGTAHRPIMFHEWVPGESTHDSGRILDYFITSKAECTEIHTLTVEPSDHSPVVAKFNF